MSAPSPDCLVQDGSGSFVPTPGGVDVTPGNTITVKLASSAGVQSWQLAIVGYDEITVDAIPAVTSVVGPPQSFTFPYPNATGRTLRFQSTVTDNQIPANTYVSTFALYTLIAGARVIAFGETTEGNSKVGYVASVNPLIRGAVGGSNATQIQSVPVDATPPAAFQVLASLDGTNWAPISLTTDWTPAGFTPTLSFAGGGTSPQKLGTPITPTFNGNPQPNGSGVTVYTISDDQGGGHSVSRLGSGGGFQGPSTTYTNSPTTSAQTVTWTAHVTKSGVAKTAAVAVVWADEIWHGVGTGTQGASTATGINGTSGVLAGATGTLAAVVSASGKVAFSDSPANQKLYYVGPAGLTFKDANGSSVPMFSTSITVTNSNSVSTTRTLYESVNLLSSVANPVTPS